MVEYKSGTKYVIKDECLGDIDKWIENLETRIDSNWIPVLQLVSKALGWVRTDCIERKMTDKDEDILMAHLI